MGFLEAVVVLYLRRMLGTGFVHVRAAPSGPAWNAVAGIELAREAATILMILAVALLAARGWRARLGAFALVFGVWDIAYYGWLALLVSWPRSLFDRDLLFLIPAPWWGPVLTPLLVAAVLVGGGTRLLLAPRGVAARPVGLAAASLGGVLLMVSFLLAGPSAFTWALYLPALALFALGLLSA